MKDKVMRYELIDTENYTISESQNTYSLIVARKDGQMIKAGEWFGFFGMTNNPEVCRAMVEANIIKEA